jgi:hypothetical protein
VFLLAAGGSFVAGTYDLVSTTRYGAPDAGADAAVAVDPTPAREASFVAGAGNGFTVENAITSGMAEVRSNGMLTTDGTTQLTFTPTCPASGDGGAGSPGKVDYTAATTASGTTVTIISHENDGTITAKVYKKR